MDDGLYDLRTWPQAGRDQFERILLRAKEQFLVRCLNGEAGSLSTFKSKNEIEAILASVRQKLTLLEG